MSICPNDDIHSLYIDGELTSPYKEQFLLHIQNCSKCNSTLQRMKSLHLKIQEDAESINLSDVDLARSFTKLSTIMKFTQTTGKSKKLNPVYELFPVITAVAAALIIAIIPFSKHNQNTQNQNLSQFLSQTDNTNSTLVKKGILADSNLAQEIIKPDLENIFSYNTTSTNNSNLINVSSLNNYGVLKLDNPLDLYRTDHNLYNINNSNISGLMY